MCQSRTIKPAGAAPENNTDNRLTVFPVFPEQAVLFHQKIRHRAESTAATAAASRLLRVQRNNMRKHQPPEITPCTKKLPPSGGTSRRDSGCLSHVARSAQRYAQLPATWYTSSGVSYRRDDRAMITQKRAGRRELKFTSFPALFKLARTRARRSPIRDYSSISVQKKNSNQCELI